MGATIHKPHSRRDFLKLALGAAGGVLLAGCKPVPGVLPTVQPAITPVGRMAAGKYAVSIGQAKDYDLKTLRKAITGLFDQLGGLSDVIRPGARVAVKVNLVGGSGGRSNGATETYVTHPAVVQVLFELLRDAGASRLYLVEGIWNLLDLQVWGYQDMLKPLNIQAIDLNDTGPYKDWGTFHVTGGGLVYPDFKFNHILEEIDTFASVPKLKCHSTCGVTGSLKNLVGITPFGLYQTQDNATRRQALHGISDTYNQRLPRVVVDLNRARPVHLALIDGIKTVEGGEGPWVQTMNAIQPGVLIAGKNPVATDAIAAAVMGFDPTSDYPKAPFTHADSYLNLAAKIGLGSNHLTDIEIAGAAIDEVRQNFKPSA